MRRAIMPLVAGWVGMAVMASSAPAAGLKAGVVRVDITPPAGQLLWGYAARTTPAQGMLDPLYARVLVLEAGEKRLALVVLDLGRVFGPASLERLRAAARQSSGITNVVVQATHTHSGPVIIDEYPGGAALEWESVAVEKIGKAIDEAHQRAVEARLGTGTGSTYIGYNRVRPNADGTITMLWRNPTRVATSPVDPTLAVLRVDTAEGQPLAVLVNYACHPVVFGPENLHYSADFPGVMTRTVEAAMGGADVCFFLQGACGDINPYDATNPAQEDAVGKRDAAGRQLGEEAARVAKAIRTEAEARPRIEVFEETIPLRMRWNAERFQQGLLASYGEKFVANFAPHIREPILAPVATLLINKRIALMTLPGEPFVEFQMNWRDRCPVRNTFFLGYTNAYLGYFPTLRAAAMGGYGAASATTWVEVGAGERIVDNAVTRVYQMLGRLTDVPEDLKK
ncbi:MAG: neutral/alkaline non-lysosomal ceramidase N-terminal domain-containing protein [Terriglobia bacterium]